MAEQKSPNSVPVKVTLAEQLLLEVETTARSAKTASPLPKKSVEGTSKVLEHGPPQILLSLTKVVVVPTLATLENPKAAHSKQSIEPGHGLEVLGRIATVTLTFWVTEDRAQKILTGE